MLSLFKHPSVKNTRVLILSSKEDHAKSIVLLYFTFTIFYHLLPLNLKSQVGFATPYDIGSRCEEKDGSSKHHPLQGGRKHGVTSISILRYPGGSSWFAPTVQLFVDMLSCDQVEGSICDHCCAWYGRKCKSALGLDEMVRDGQVVACELIATSLTRFVVESNVAAKPL